MKKVVSLLLVLVLALGMSTMAFASVSVVVNGPAQNVSANSSTTGYAAPGDKYYAPIKGDTAAGQYITMTYTSQTQSATDGITKSEMSNAKVTLKTRISKGSAAIDNVDVEYLASTAKPAQKVLSNVVLEMIKPFKSNNTDGMDFEVTAYFIVDGKSYLDQGVTFSGTLKNRFSDGDVDKDTTYFDMSDGTIMKPGELAKTMEFYLGEDVSVFGRALKGVKYWAVANTDTTDADDANILKHDLDGVYHIAAIGLSSVANYVTLGAADSTQYVYDGDMKYLGRGNEHLTYAETYYLSSKELDTDTTEPTDEEEGDSSEDDTTAPNPTTGADDNYPTNVNDNPGTGR